MAKFWTAAYGPLQEHESKPKTMLMPHASASAVGQTLWLNKPAITRAKNSLVAHCYNAWYHLKSFSSTSSLSCQPADFQSHLLNILFCFIINTPVLVETRSYLG